MFSYPVLDVNVKYKGGCSMSSSCEYPLNTDAIMIVRVNISFFMI